MHKLKQGLTIEVFCQDLSINKINNINNGGLANRLERIKIMENNLGNIIQSGVRYLHPRESASLIKLLSKGCGKRNKTRIAYVIDNVSLDQWNYYGIYNRINFDDGNGEASYTVYQDYPIDFGKPQTLRTVRNCILTMAEWVEGEGWQWDYSEE